MFASGFCLARALRHAKSWRLRTRTTVAGKQSINVWKGQNCGHARRWMSSGSKPSSSGPDPLTIVLGIGGLTGVGYVLYKINSLSSGGAVSQKLVQEDSSSPPPQEDGVTTKQAERKEQFVPESAQYLIIGAGTAAFAAIRGIRTRDKEAKILIVGQEPWDPYTRTPLSKEMWYTEDRKLAEKLLFKQWGGKIKSLFFDFPYVESDKLDSEPHGGVSVIAEKKVETIDPINKKVILSDGKEITYQKVLIATGGKPRNLPIFEKANEDVKDRTILYRTIEDYIDLNKAAKKAKSIVVIGGGFLGSELACCLSHNAKETGTKIYQVFPESGNMGRVFPEYLSQWTTQKVKSYGVDVLTETYPTSAKMHGKQVAVTLNTGEQLLADQVVVAVGLDPNTELAESAGLELDDLHGGYLVNSELEARSNVWVAGDAACFYDRQLGRRRVEHHDHAVVSGKLAGRNMAGAGEAYGHQSMFWSDLGPDVGYEAIGICDSHLPTISIFAKSTEEDTPKALVEATGENVRSATEGEETAALSLDVSKEVGGKVHPRAPEPGDEFGKGVVFYMKEKRVVGVLTWNLFNRIPIARQLIKEGREHEDLSNVARLFNIHENA